MASSLSAACFCGQSAATYAGAASAPAVAARNADDVRACISNGNRELLRRGNVWGRRVQIAPHQPFPCGASKLKASPISMGWTQVSNDVLKTISSGDDKTVLGTDTNDDVHMLIDDKFERLTGKMKQVSVGYSGRWAVDENNQLYKWDGFNNEFSEIDSMPGTGKIQCVASGQDVYVTDTNRQIFKHQGDGKWLKIDGGLDLIDTNDYNDIWGVYIGERREVYRRVGSGWVFVPGPEGRDNVKQVSTGIAGVWALNTNGTIYRWVMNTTAQGAWFKEEGSLSSISSGYPTVWGLDSNGKVYKYTA